jgi:hypothetical protein
MRVASPQSLTNDVVEFGQDNTLTVRITGDLERSEVGEILAALVHHAFCLITERRPQDSFDARHAIVRLGHR